MPKYVILNFDSDESESELGFKQRIQNREAKKGNEIALEDIKVIYPADISKDRYMTWIGTEPSEEDKAVLQSLKGGDRIYLWGHGVPNSGYMPGGFYTEIADYLAKGLNKNNFSLANPLLIATEICSGARGGEHGKNSFAALLHSYLGKIGIPATVTGRLYLLYRNHDQVSTQGTYTIPRNLYVLSELGVPVPDNSWGHQAPHSKATFMWDPIASEHQIRVDSYRFSLRNEFMRFKEALLIKVHSPESKIINFATLHKQLLDIEFLLSNDSQALKVPLLKAKVTELYNYCSEVIGLDKTELKKLGFNSFKKAMERKAHTDGLIREKTGLHRSDPKTPIEEKSLADVVADVPPLKKLDGLVTKIKNKENISQPILDAIGSKETNGEDNYYAHYFTMIRKHFIVQNDGTTNIPEYYSRPMSIVNKMLEVALLNEDTPLKDRQKSYQNLKKELDNYYNPSWFSKIKSLLKGAMLGLKVGFRERHEASFFETIPSMIYSAYEFANLFLDNWATSCEHIEKVTKICEDSLKIPKLTEEAKSTSKNSFFSHSSSEAAKKQTNENQDNVSPSPPKSTL